MKATQIKIDTAIRTGVYNEVFRICRPSFSSKDAKILKKTKHLWTNVEFTTYNPIGSRINLEVLKVIKNVLKTF